MIRTEQPIENIASRRDARSRFDSVARNAIRRRSGMAFHMLLPTLIFALLCIVANVLGGSARAADLTTPYIDPTYLTKVPFGSHSHWQQPWRAYLETIPASQFVDGTGIVFDVTAREAELYAEMLARYGIHNARFEVAWGSVNFDNEMEVNDPTLAPRLAALKRNGIRPVILINANSSQPCPRRPLQKTLAKDAARGDRTIVLNNVNGIVPGYTGFAHLGADYATASPLIVAVNGNVATISKPLPRDLASGTPADFVTLKYRPFSSPGNADYEATMKGWQTYALNVARTVRADLGTTGQPDGGFDMEIWNELSFGSEFLSIKNYYRPGNETNYLPQSESRIDFNIYHEIVVATVSVAESHPDLFSGVAIADGFSNTIPWPAGSNEPLRISAICKHPYQPQIVFPRAERKGPALDAALQKTTFVPSYVANFPEYWATFLNTESIIRDIAPINTPLAGTQHGRFSRVLDGKPDPVYVWITEVNNSPSDAQPAISVEAAEAIKAKTTARYFTFYLNKGVKQVDIYAANEKETGLGMVRHNFRSYVKTAEAYPNDDLAYVSPALAVTGRIVKQMKDGLDRGLTNLRSLHVNSVSSDHDDVIFTGDGSAAHPDLRAIDVFAFLPYQVNAHKFVIPYYVMTRDVTHSWAEDMFHINVSGFRSSTHFSVYDPFTDMSEGVKAVQAGNGVQIDLKAGDSPRLLIANDE